MCALRHSAIWPQLVAISLIGLWAAGCSADSGRFGEGFSSSSSRRRRAAMSPARFRRPRRQATSKAVRCRTLPAPTMARRAAAAAWAPISQTAKSPARSPPHRRRRRVWTWEGGTPITVGPGETLETHRAAHGVPVSAIMEANNITSAASGPSGRAPRHSALSFVSGGAMRAGKRAQRRPLPPMPAPVGRAADRAGGAAGRACRGAGRNAQQHRADLRQAGAWSLPTPTISPPTPW